MPKTITKEFKQTEIGKIPVEWDLKLLREVCVKTTTINPAKNPNTVIEYVDVSSVSREGCRIVGATKYTGKDAPGRARNLVKHRDVIFATVRPTLRRVALVPKDLDGQVVSTAFCVIRALEAQAHPEYLYYVVSSPDFVARVGRLERGASYPAVTDANIFTQKIALPARPEQERIAGVLSKIQRAVENQEKKVLDLRELKAASILKLFRDGLRGEPLKQTEIGEIPKSWELLRLADLVEVRGGKRLPKGRSLLDSKTPFPYIRVSDLSESTVDVACIKYLPSDVQPKISRYIITPKDVYMSIAGTIGLVGIIPPVLDGANLTENAARLVIFPDKIKQKYLMFFLLSEYGQRQISMATVKNAQPKLAITRIEAFYVPVPSPKEQQEILETLENLDLVISNSIEKLTLLRKCFSSTLNQLMTGKVRAAD